VVRLIIIVVAFFLLLGAVVGGLYFWGIDPLAKLGVSFSAKAPENPIIKMAPPGFVDLGLVVVPVIEDREVRRQAELIVRVQCAPGQKETVAKGLTRLQAAFLEDLIAFIPKHLREAGMLDPQTLRQHLLPLAQKVAGQGKVDDVLIENAVLKPTF
jgi:hypothetical protein